MKMPHEKNAFENFRDLAKKVVAVPKKEMARREAAYRNSRKPRSRGKSN